MSTPTAADVTAAFTNNSLDIKQDAVATCVELCKEFALSAESLAEQWDVFAMNASIQVATIDSLGRFRAMLFDQTNKRAIKRETKETLKGKSMVKKEPLASVYGIHLPTVHETPKKRQASASFQSPDAKMAKASVFSPSSFQSPPSAEYASRANAGEVVDSFNTSLKSQINVDGVRGDAVKVECIHTDTHMSMSVIPLSYRDDEISKSNVRIIMHAGAANNFMYTSMSDRAIALDQLLVDFQTRMEAQLAIDCGAVGDPSPSHVTVCGRIVCEAPEGKLNASVVQLEGARKYCGGQRVLLDLSQVPALEAFPGKPEPVPFAVTIANDTAPVRIFTAAGPFTPHYDPQYQPLSDLIAVAAKQKPDVVILVVQESLCVNPGQLSKGQAGGTYAELTILPKGHHETPEAHQVAQRTLVEVKRI
ncbi:hypothetical protein DYB28_007137 [Aphanomyces astaci]|uniref:DNA polymerase alpha subunit B N-terminal domain-containing protein n=1 Tax=Aphanomyces astaci TaxID=112090 RepID=A0A9X8DWT1_APHAT|nr:hypothetical protein DYB28_007137 [Aphanomyces astaci]